MRFPGAPRTRPLRRWQVRSGAQYDIREIYFAPPYDPDDADPFSIAGCYRRWDWHISCGCARARERSERPIRLGVIYK